MMVNDQSLAENLKAIFPEHGDLSDEEFILQQASFYESIRASVRNNCSRSDHSQEGQSSHSGSFDLEPASDEAFARSLQEHFDKIFIDEQSSNAAGSTDGPRETTVRANAETVVQDDVDPDNMTYEQLQSLGETVGSESRGLPKRVISQLRTFKYKTRLFSKKAKMEQRECVICCMSYKNGDRIMALPCAHQYHAQCISHWLAISKKCPVCQTEVQDE